MSSPGLPLLFTREERNAIAAQARADGLSMLACPRDGSRLTVYTWRGREVSAADGVSGVRRGPVDIEQISVECPTCEGGAAYVSLTMAPGC